VEGVVSVAFVIFGALLAVIGLLQLVISRRMVAWGFAWPPTVTAARISGAAMLALGLMGISFGVR